MQMRRVSALGSSREIAARHHERLDGSGYPRGLTAASLTQPDRLLAAADAYHAMTEPRPHRAPLDPDQASRELRAEVIAGRLDGEAVDAILRAAGHRAPARLAWPGGLTAREVEVLRLLARGHSNKQIAQRLVVSPKTAGNHVEHIYSKLVASSRAAATLFATQHGLMGTFIAPVRALTSVIGQALEHRGQVRALADCRETGGVAREVLMPVLRRAEVVDLRGTSPGYLRHLSNLPELTFTAPAVTTVSAKGPAGHEAFASSPRAGGRGRGQRG